MGRIIKGLFSLGLVFVVLLVVAGVFGWFKLSSVLKHGISEYGSQMVGAPVEVSHIGVSPFKGQLTIRALAVGSPRGFKAEDTLTVDKIYAAVDFSFWFVCSQAFFWLGSA